jgi:hypothetical protein
LEKVLDEYIALDKEKRFYDKQSQRSATVSMYGIFGYLVAQFGMLAQYEFLFLGEVTQSVWFGLTSTGTLWSPLPISFS